MKPCVKKRKGLNFGFSDWILHHDNAPAHKALPVKQFVAQKLITEIEHPLCSPDLDPNDFCLFSKIKSIIKGRRFQDIEDIRKKKSDDTESCSNKRSSKNVSIVGLSAQLLKGSTSKVSPLSKL
jgi:hypothetical protein